MSNMGTSRNGRAAAQGTPPVISAGKADSEDILSVGGLHYSNGKFAAVPSWDNNDHYKKINFECKIIIAFGMDHSSMLDDLMRNLPIGIAKSLKEKLQDVYVGEEGFARISDAAPEDQPEMTLNLLQQHSGAPTDYYITMTAAAMLDAGCPEEALTPILALYDEPLVGEGYSSSCYIPKIDEKVSLHFAARNNHKSLMQLLLRHPDNDVNRLWNYADGGPIHLAAEHDHGDVMQVLLDSPGIQVDLPGCGIRNPENEPRYLGFCPHVNEPSWWIPATPILIAARHGSANALKAMLQHPTMAQLVNDPIFTGEAWCFAVYRNHPECVSLLEELEKKPDGEGGMLSLMCHHLSHGSSALSPTQHQLCIGNLMAEAKVEAARSSSDGNKKRQSGHKKTLEQIWSGITKKMAQQVEQQAADRMANELLKEEEHEKKSMENKKAKRKARKAAKKLKDRDNAGDDDVSCDACSSHRASDSHQESPYNFTPCVRSTSSPSSAADSSSVSARQQDDDPSAKAGGPRQHSQPPTAASSQTSVADDAGQHEEDPQLVKTLLQTLVLSSEAPPSRSMSRTPSSTTDDPSSKDVAARTNNKNSRETNASHAVPPKTLAERLGLKVPIPVFVPSPHPI